MLSIQKSLSMALVFSAISMPLPTPAQGPVFISQSGYITLYTGGYGSNPPVVRGGDGLTLTVDAFCSGNATVTYYISTNTSSVGSVIVTIPVGDQGTYGYSTPPNPPGTYYISAYLNLNGETDCQLLNGGSVSVTPQYLTFRDLGQS